jgi:hypothetical protein
MWAKNILSDPKLGGWVAERISVFYREALTLLDRASTSSIDAPSNKPLQPTSGGQAEVE